MPYENRCPDCGSNNDYGERCDCGGKSFAAASTNIPDVEAGFALMLAERCAADAVRT